MDKKYKLFIEILCISMFMIFTSCSNEQDEDLSETLETIDIIGTWKICNSDTDNFKFIDYMQFRTDGQLIRVDNGNVSILRWERIGDNIIVDGFKYDILKLTKTELQLSILGVVINCVRVSDSEIEKYLD